jgi:hypothetical protein
MLNLCHVCLCLANLANFVCCAAIEDAVLNASVATVKLNTYADSGEAAEALLACSLACFPVAAAASHALQGK